MNKYKSIVPKQRIMCRHNERKSSVDQEVSDSYDIPKIYGLPYVHKQPPLQDAGGKNWRSYSQDAGQRDLDPEKNKYEIPDFGFDADTNMLTGGEPDPWRYLYDYISTFPKYERLKNVIQSRVQIKKDLKIQRTCYNKSAHFDSSHNCQPQNHLLRLSKRENLEGIISTALSQMYNDITQTHGQKPSSQNMAKLWKQTLVMLDRVDQSLSLIHQMKKQNQNNSKEKIHNGDQAYKLTEQFVQQFIANLNETTTENKKSQKISSVSYNVNDTETSTEFNGLNSARRYMFIQNDKKKYDYNFAEPRYYNKNYIKNNISAHKSMPRILKLDQSIQSSCEFRIELTDRGTGKLQNLNIDEIDRLKTEGDEQVDKLNNQCDSANEIIIDEKLKIQIDDKLKKYADQLHTQILIGILRLKLIKNSYSQIEFNILTILKNYDFDKIKNNYQFQMLFDQRIFQKQQINQNRKILFNFSQELNLHQKFQNSDTQTQASQIQSLIYKPLLPKNLSGLILDNSTNSRSILNSPKSRHILNYQNTKQQSQSHSMFIGNDSDIREIPMTAPYQCYTNRKLDTNLKKHFDIKQVNIKKYKMRKKGNCTTLGRQIIQDFDRKLAIKSSSMTNFTSISYLKDSQGNKLQKPLMENLKRHYKRHNRANSLGIRLSTLNDEQVSGQNRCLLESGNHYQNAIY